MAIAYTPVSTTPPLTGAALVAAVNAALALLANSSPPIGGRLTLASATPIMTSSQSNKSSVIWTPYVSQWLPIYNGTLLSMTDMGGELSQATTDTTKSPAAAQPYSCYDIFGWIDGTTPRATRGPTWSQALVGATITIAAPGVVTWAGHSLFSGNTVSFTTTGALPTGITAGTDYFITVVNSSTFKLSTTLANQVAGTFITTSGSQSGVHTVQCRTVSRGSGAGTSELVMIKGVMLNANAITNGPGAQRGTYLGTVMSNSTSTIDWTPGSAAAGGGISTLGVWNYYNRVDIRSFVQDTTVSGTFSSATVGPFLGSANNRVTYVIGLCEDAAIVGVPGAITCAASAGAFGYIGMGADTTTFIDKTLGSTTPIASSLTNYGFVSETILNTGIGFHYVQQVQQGDGATTSTTYGLGGTPPAANALRFGLDFKFRM